eukprot:2296888-Rhodomonas_salina.1
MEDVAAKREMEMAFAIAGGYVIHPPRGSNPRPHVWVSCLRRMITPSIASWKLPPAQSTRREYCVGPQAGARRSEHL